MTPLSCSFKAFNFPGVSLRRTMCFVKCIYPVIIQKSHTVVPHCSVISVIQYYNTTTTILAHVLCSVEEN